MFEHNARALLTPPCNAREQATDGAPVTGRMLLESDSAQARSLEHRSLTMYSTLRLPDRSRLRLLDLPRPLAPASAEQKGLMSVITERREPA